MADEEHLPIEEKGCPIEMHGGRRCGRPIYPEDLAHDPMVCLMHSLDPGKSDAIFQREFEAILEAAGDGVADFTSFVFPTTNYEGRKFTAACVFNAATFMKEAWFNGATFTQLANFSSVTFTQDAYFHHATFTLEADFLGAKFALDAVFRVTTFTQDADFRGASFTQEADFLGATFTQKALFGRSAFMQNADFRDAEFTQKARFDRATFTQGANFWRARFVRDADFGHATFTRDAHFTEAMFTEEVGFWRATFTQDADFSGATFAQEADFREVTFQQDVLFNGGKFAQKVSFEGARFLGRVEFRRTRFRHDKKGPGRRLPGPVFSLAEFAQPEKVIFDRVYLGQTLFYRCDVSRVNFSLVMWRRRKGSRNRMLFEQVVSLKAARDLEPSRGSVDKRRYGLIAELYQQLKKNFDERKDYWTAGDFHYGEMEMKRMATKSPGSIGRLLGRLHFRMRRGAMRSLGRAGLNRWRAKRLTRRLPKRVGLTKDLVNDVWRSWHRHLSLVAWYKYASLYGESYARPVWCLALVLLLFTFLFPIVGLDWNDTKSPPGGTSASQQSLSQTANKELSYGHFTDFVKAYNGRKWLARPAFFGNSLMTALSVAGFQKELKYEPSYPWGRALALLELLLTSTLAALFLLAVRRQFRR